MPRHPERTVHVDFVSVETTGSPACMLHTASLSTAIDTGVFRYIPFFLRQVSHFAGLCLTVHSHRSILAGGEGGGVVGEFRVDKRLFPRSHESFAVIHRSPRQQQTGHSVHSGPKHHDSLGHRLPVLPGLRMPE